MWVCVCVSINEASDDTCCGTLTVDIDADANVRMGEVVEGDRVD